MADELIWIDTETTGLESDAIPLEIAVVITDKDLNELSVRSFLVNPYVPIASLRYRVTSVVDEMHTKNGLWEDLSNPNRRILHAPEVDQLLHSWLSSAMESNSAPMAGSTIGFDRRICREFFPRVETFCHYRSIDVSSTKELARRWAPTIYQNRPGEEADKVHRAYDDIQASIEEMKYYRKYFLNCELT